MTTIITEQEVGLYKPQRQGNFAESGGSVTSSPIDPSRPDEIFPDLTEFGRVDNETEIAKVFLGVNSGDDATYQKCHVMLAKGPSDPNVHVALFSTGDHHDARADIQSAMESAGFIASTEHRWILMGAHPQGMGSVRLFSLSNAPNAMTPVSDPQPEPNDVVCLSVEGAGLTAHRQYQRIGTKLAEYNQLFTEGDREFYKTIIVLTISQPLDQDYPGVETVVRTASFARPTLVRSCQFADALDCKGIKKLQVDASATDSIIKIDSPYGVLVPSSTTSTPLVDQPAVESRPTYVQAGAANSLAASAALAGAGTDHAATLYFGTGFLPGSLALSIGGAAHTDNGNGAISGPTGTLFGGTVDYGAGEVRITASAAWAQAVSATATPAATVYGAAYTKAATVLANTQSLNWVDLLSPVPAPQTVSVDYRAAKRWYRMEDNGKGALVDAIGGGGGSVDYTSGSTIATTGALPDIGSSILYSWGSPVRAANRAGTAIAVTPEIVFDLDEMPVPGSYSVSWLSDGETKTATDNGAGGLTGDATGTLLYAGKKVRLRPAAMPDANSQFASDYDYGSPAAQTFNPILRPGGAAGEYLVGAVFSNNPSAFGGWFFSPTSAWYFSGWPNVPVPVNADASAYAITLTLTDAPEPGSVHIKYPLGHVRVTGNASGSTASYVELQDDGQGGLIIIAGPGVPDGTPLVGAVVSYAAKTITFAPVLPPHGTGSYYGQPAQNPFTWLEGSPITVQYISTATPTGTIAAEIAPVPPVAFDFTPLIADASAPGAVRFEFGGSIYVDREGLLYRDVSPTTGSGLPAGTYDYAQSRAELTDWPAGATGSASVTALATVNGDATATAIHGRVKGAPLSVGQFILRATSVEGIAVLLTANSEGEISGEWGIGAVDWETGVYGVEFGAWLEEADAHWPRSPVAWADAEHHPSNSTRWRPLEILSGTAQFNAVTLSFLPVSSARLGVQAERLPLDGKVLQYRPGDVCVVHRTERVTLPNPILADHIYDLGEERLTCVKVWDQNGQPLPSTEWSASEADLDAGRIQTAPAVNTSGLVQPFVAEYRIEDVVKLGTRVDISGLLEFSPALTHDYPAANSYISSTLYVGDIRARISAIVEQAAWTNVWSDSLIGSAPLAQYDDAGFPIEVRNYPAKTERLALIFNGNTAFDCYGEHSGLIGSGNTATDFEITDRTTGDWYIRIKAAGWGGGWGAGNVLRLNFESSTYPLDLVRAALQGASAPIGEDIFTVEIRGYSNRSE